MKRSRDITSAALGRRGVVRTGHAPRRNKASLDRPQVVAVLFEKSGERSSVRLVDKAHAGVRHSKNSELLLEPYCTPTSLHAATAFGGVWAKLAAAAAST